MNKTDPHILLLEPYFGGSHRAFLEGLQKSLPFRFTLVSLPARKWKMRMQLAAPWMVDETIRLIEQGMKFDAILCSTFIDVATLRVLLSQKGIFIPVALYFHENQFAYPNQVSDPASYQFSALNFTSALAADAIAFNSNYNQETFMEGVAGYLNKATDMNLDHKVEELRQKSVVLYPGIDFSDFDSEAGVSNDNTPVVVWNHRWEHDKNPEEFFKTMMQLSTNGVNFKLIVLGQHFTRCPEIFETSKKTWENHIIHFGYAPQKKEYIRLLHLADIVVSTAIHEFFGMAVLEAVHCGCRPLVPDRLSYRELFPMEYRYAAGALYETIASLINNHQSLEQFKLLKIAKQYSWQNMASKYEHWLLSIL